MSKNRITPYRNITKQLDLSTLFYEEMKNICVLKDKVKDSLKKAKEAENRAKDAKVKVSMFWGKKEAIELLQKASEALADGLVTMAEAQKISFVCQNEISKITKCLFMLGAKDMTNNRLLVEKLQSQIQSQSQSQLQIQSQLEESLDADISDFIQEELKNVVIQLNAQKDMFEKQKDLTERVKKLEKTKNKSSLSTVIFIGLLLFLVYRFTPFFK